MTFAQNVLNTESGVRHRIVCSLGVCVSVVMLLLVLLLFDREQCCCRLCFFFSHLFDVVTKKNTVAIKPTPRAAHTVATTR